MKTIGILIETDNGIVKDANLGMINLARQGGADLHALVADGISDETCAVLAEYGVTQIVDLGLPEESAQRLNPQVRAEYAVAAVCELDLDGVFGLSTAEGKDLLPRVAALLDAPLVMDCVAVDIKENIGTTSQYSGKVMADIQLTGEMLVFGIRPNAMAASASPVEAKVLSPDLSVKKQSNLKLIAWEEDTSSDGPVSLAEADIIISGGRGMKNKENFSLIFDCADKLKAAVGASRVAVDEGWIPYAHQVGQTGEKVSPSVYIACGISGSVQHFAGMKTAKMIIAVNTDKEAAMMANSDYCIQGDLFEILPELIKQL